MGKEMKKQFRDFESAREFVRKLGLKTQKEWLDYCKSGNKPDDVPSTPSGPYKNNGWSGFGDWLGTGNIAPQDRVYQSFTEAREFARGLKFKNRKEWFEYCKSGNKPDNIPNTPNQVYKNDFKGFGDWLGTGRTRNYRSFEKAREFARGLKFKNRKEWRKYSKSHNKPQNIPASPEKTYKKDWKGMGDWLGTGTVAAIDKEYRSFEKAREFARGLKFKNTKEWQEYCKSGNKPDDVPSTPSGPYKNDFKGMGDFLGTGTIPSQDIVYRSFEKAREFVRSLNLKKQKEWHVYCKSGNKPDDIPQKPERTYKNNGWSGFGDWLGTGTVAHKDRVFRPFAESREFVRSLGLKTGKEWQEYCKSGKKPDDIPAHPWDVYKEWKK
jgi:hypothetical protein